MKEVSTKCLSHAQESSEQGRALLTGRLQAGGRPLGCPASHMSHPQQEKKMQSRRTRGYGGLGSHTALPGPPCGPSPQSRERPLEGGGTILCPHRSATSSGSPARRRAELRCEPQQSGSGLSPAAVLSHHAISSKPLGLDLGAPKGILTALAGKGKWISLSSGPEAPFRVHRLKGRSWKDLPCRQRSRPGPAGVYSRCQGASSPSPPAGWAALSCVLIERDSYLA